MDAAHYSGKAEEDVDGAQEGYGGCDGGGNGDFVGDVYGLEVDLGVGKLSPEGQAFCFCCSAVDVEEHEAGKAVFEEGFGGFESEGAGSACDSRWFMNTCWFFMDRVGKGKSVMCVYGLLACYNDLHGISFDFESESCSTFWFQIMGCGNGGTSHGREVSFAKFHLGKDAGPEGFMLGV